MVALVFNKSANNWAPALLIPHSETSTSVTNVFCFNASTKAVVFSSTACLNKELEAKLTRVKLSSLFFTLSMIEAGSF